MPLVYLISTALLAAAYTAPSHALPMGHHGGLVTQCNDPIFYDQTPPPDQHLARLETIEFTASPNTEPSSIEVRVNLEILKTEINIEKSGYRHVEARLPNPITNGRAWVKVTAMSDDGCHALSSWNIYTGQ